MEVLSPKDRMLSATLVVAAVGFVLLRSWVCDDAFITLRHVANLHAGHGPVFNPGERVQAFSHPLWFLLISAVSTFAPIYATVIAVSLAMVAATFVLLVRFNWFADAGGRIWLVALVTLLLSSRSFVEFSTSGLEGPLTHLLILFLFGMLVSKGLAGQPIPSTATAWLCALLLLNRPDHLFFCLPIVIGTLVQVLRKGRSRISLPLVASVLPLAAWYGFAAIYYGTPLPNTAYAKVAFSNRIAVGKGLSYLADYAVHEPFQAAAILLSLGVVLGWGVHGLLRKQPGAGIVLMLGLAILLELAYVVRMGGDFMRGRLIVPILIASTITAVPLAKHLLRGRRVDVFAALLVWLGGIMAVVSKMPAAAIAGGLLYLPTAVANTFGAHWPRYAIGAAAFAAFALLAGLRLRSLGGKRAVLVLALLLAAATVLLVGMAAYPQPTWTVQNALLMAAALAAGAYLAAAASAGSMTKPWPLAGLGLAVGAIAVFGDLRAPSATWDHRTRIAYEWAWYRPIRWHNPFTEPLASATHNTQRTIRVGLELREYAERHGSVCVTAGAVGMLAYYGGPLVQVIDYHGLADAFIARGGVPPDSRIGHIDYELPEEYLRLRGAVNILPGWWDRLLADDPGLAREAAAMMQDAELTDPEHRARWELVRLVTRGPIFALDRLAALGRYAVGSHHQIPPWPGGRHPRWRYWETSHVPLLGEPKQSSTPNP